MVYRSSTTPPPNKRNTRPRAQRLKVYFLPWVLVPAYDDAGFIAVYEQQRLFWRFMSE
jgi:hypothetical protein